MQTVVTAFRIVEEVANRQPIGLSELSRLLDRPKSSVHRCLRTLEEVGWVRPADEKSGQWVLTARAAIIAGATGKDTALRQVARPILERLRDDTNESTRLAVAEREEFVIIERVECRRDVRIHDEFGHHGPNYATDLGKAILAFSSKEERERLLPRRLTAFTDQTITDRETLNRELELVRERGWVTCMGEARPDVGGVAAAVLNASGKPIAAINVFFPLHRSPEDGGKNYGRLVSQAAESISKALL
jgi:IclR family acetate operon transcriptional repressor